MLFLSNSEKKGAVMYSKTLLLRFPKEIVDKPIITSLVRDYDLTFNILKAKIFPRKEGMLVMELLGGEEDFAQGVQYLEKIGVLVEPVGHGIHRDEDRCCQCGACTAVCPTGALHVIRPEMEVSFESERCSACELCVKACPVRAMVVTFDREIA
jgi:ferredoxin